MTPHPAHPTSPTEPDPTGPDSTHPNPTNPNPTNPSLIDPRSPRFGAAITSLLLLVAVTAALIGSITVATWLLAGLATLFGWAAFAGIGRHPYGVVFRRVIRPRLAAPDSLEHPAAPTFAQGVGFVITAVGVALQLVGVPGAVLVAASLAFVAAFLNALFDVCLGCLGYTLLVRWGLAGRRRTVARTTG